MTNQVIEEQVESQQHIQPPTEREEISRAHQIATPIATPGLIAKVKGYLIKNFEGAFILLILISVCLINYFIYFKAAFLNFYFLPIMTAGYYLGKKMAVLGAFFSILMTSVFILAEKEAYLVPAGELELYFNLTIWGGFLILAGWWIGSLTERFQLELQENKKLQYKLTQEKALLKASNRTVEGLKVKVEDTLFTVMDANVARMMIEGKLRTEKRRISILFSDLKDFTSYSEAQPPEQVLDELNIYISKMEKCILKYFGHIDRYMGDGIMVEFGAPLNYQFHSLMAVLAGLNMQSVFRSIDGSWKMRIGIATGPAVIGLFGAQRKSYSCIGDAANLASRLEEICDPGGVFIDEETYNDIKPYINVTQINSFAGQRATDNLLENKINDLKADLEQVPGDLKILISLGDAYFENKAASAAIECYQKVLKLDPNNTKAKLGFADANLKKEEFEKIAIKGKKDRIAVYRVLGLLDTMKDRTKIPQSFYDKYYPVITQIKIPDDVILPIESIDGRVGHGKVTAIIAYAIADVLGLSIKEKEEILIAGHLHDVGNAIIPPELLDSNRKLSASEYEIIKKHPDESVRLLKQMGYHSPSLLKIVETHHERWNGSGYPNGLTGESIPLGGRILSVADTFDAMTSKRLYAGTWEYKSAIREIEKESLSDLYDPRCFEILKGLFGV